MSLYPGAADDLTSGVPDDATATTAPLGSSGYPHDDHHRALGQAVEAVEGELGLNPSGVHDTVAARFTADETKLDGIEAGADVTDSANVNAAGAVMESDYDANTILAATTDNTPAALTVAEQTLVGRVTGGAIDDLSASAVRTLLDVPTNGEAVLDTLYDANTIVAANTDNTPAAVTVAEQRIVGRITGGNIDDLTAAQAGNVLLGGAWASYTPAIVALDPFGSFGGAVDPTMGTGASLTGAYVQVGRLVIGRCLIVFGTSGVAAGTGYYGISLPVTPRNTDQPIGVGYMLDASDSYRYKTAPISVAGTFSSTLAVVFIHDGQAAAGSAPVSHFAPWTWAASDAIFFSFTYEAAADA